jgi:hypothetical protein
VARKRRGVQARREAKGEYESRADPTRPEQTRPEQGRRYDEKNGQRAALLGLCTMTIKSLGYQDKTCAENPMEKQARGALLSYEVLHKYIVVRSNVSGLANNWVLCIP